MYTAGREARLASVNYPRTGRVVREYVISSQDSDTAGDIRIRVYIPLPAANLGEHADQRYPILVFLHGGAWCIGDMDFDEPLCNIACVQARVVVVNVDYRLAPEFPFPHGLNDSYNAVKWAVLNANELRADVSKGLVVGGISAGANFAAVIALRARSDPVLRGRITGQMLQMPWLCVPTAYPPRWRNELASWEENKSSPSSLIETSGIMMQLMRWYAGPEHDTNWQRSPLLAESHHGLPPAYFQCAGLDPLRDEAFVYQKILHAEGIPTKVDFYDGLPHAFASIFPRMRASEKWRNDFVAGLVWLLSLGGKHRQRGLCW